MHLAVRMVNSTSGVVAGKKGSCKKHLHARIHVGHTLAHFLNDVGSTSFWSACNPVNAHYTVLNKVAGTQKPPPPITANNRVH